MITTTILIVVLGGGFLWAYRAGKRSNRLDQMVKAQEVVREVSEDAKKIDEKTKDHINRADPIGTPWVFKKRK